jgi:Tfp pilus tip-associated adhesin PilY1
MGVAPIYYISLSKTSQATKEFFTGDSEGNVLYCDMKGDPSSWNLKSIFQLRTVANPDRPVAITQLFEIWQRWLFGGTSNLMVPGKRQLANDEQFIFGLNLRQNPNLGGASVSAMTTSDLVRLKYMKDDIFPEWTGAEEGNQETVPADAKGWRLQLRPKVIHETEPTEAEYVTTPPAIYQGVLYVSTFIARTRQPDDDEKCPELGDGKLYAFDPMTGRGMWSGGRQALVFSNIKIAGISASNGRLFLGIKVLQAGALGTLSQHSDLEGFKTYAEGTTIALSALGVASGGEPDVPYNIPFLHYWKERF